MNNIGSDKFLQLIPQLLSEQGNVEFSPHGVSMLPTISDRDKVLLVPPVNIKKYDIVLYKRQNGKAVLHRVIGVDKSRNFIMRGDSQWNPERGVHAGDLLAKVSVVIRGSKLYPSVGPRFYVCSACINAKNEAVWFAHSVYHKLRNITKK